MKSNLYLIALISILINCKLAQNSATEFVPTFSVSKKTTHKIPEGQDYTFGYLEVLENRNNPNGNRIKLPIYIFKSRSKNPKPDPILYTVGGPGYTSMRASKYMEYYKYLDDRDFILFEQRGTQYAKPSLDCPEWAHAVYESNLPNFDTTKTDSLFQKAAKICNERLRKNGIDLNSYTTNQIAADINDLVNVLGIEEYNLLTMSYSTKIGQVLVRDYPDKIRSVVMDSPLPLEVNYDEESVNNLLGALDKLLSDCQADSDCNNAFPDIKSRFLKYLEEKTINPLEVKVENPKSGEPETFYLKGKDLTTVFTSASTGSVPNIPFEINKLLNNDLTSVKERLQYLFQEPGGGIGKGMRLSVWCAEENPFNSQEKIALETNKYPAVKGLSPTVFGNEICNIWNVQKVSEIENESIKSDIPTLLISGEYDNETPVKWARLMTNNLTNSHHLIFKGWKHGPTTYWSNPCAMQAANEFFNNPTFKPNPECFGQIESPIFKTD
ncbi:alpha/beta fold hydrolase [Maribacter sp. PR1]|uniref:Alpha/beta fold hydrolase n=1 Tax=Maribacter cobaltidurans TaxID=1178778 RepID=A0ABU7IR61_9FLAO|nr:MULTISPECIES: alpha/beta fold hydrolase [Maribacter]MDC6387969.1 alpha/beta fold hydrolase [Maribacter sp. PR1]MEE1975358.1 alpha/beta fold hydrolase [Maribacter cobaltidurans]